MADLLHRLEEAEAELSMANDVIEKKDVNMNKLRISKSETEDVIKVLPSDLETFQKKSEAATEELQGWIVDLQENVDRLEDEIQKLKVGEAFDLEVIINSPVFVVIRDHLEDSTDDELVRRIKEVCPDLNLVFLMAGGLDSLDASSKGPEIDPKETDPKEVDPNTTDPSSVDPKEIDPDSVSQVLKGDQRDDPWNPESCNSVELISSLEF